jgi:hypothetical protein
VNLKLKKIKYLCCDLELISPSHFQEAPPLEEVKLSPAELLQQEAEDRKEIEKRVKSFRHITENHYLCPRKINKQFRYVPF